MAQQDNNKSANISGDTKVDGKTPIDLNADQAGKPGEDRATGERTAPQNQGDKADTKQTAK